MIAATVRYYVGRGAGATGPGFGRSCYRSFSSGTAGKPIYVAGQGMVSVTRNRDATIKSMGSLAISEALKDAGANADEVSALYVGNMLSGMLSNQQHLGPYLATAAGLNGVEAATTEACCGAGGAALRMGYMALASGMHETVVVAGVEQMTHADKDSVTKGLATASDWDYEGGHGATFPSLNGVLMAMYMEKYGVSHDQFFPFAQSAHENAQRSGHSTLKKNISILDYEASRVNSFRILQVLLPYSVVSILTCCLSQTISDPVKVYDASPICDGAAAVVLTTNSELANRMRATKIRLAGSGAASDILAVKSRPNPLELKAVEKSIGEALSRAKIGHQNVDIFELHDAYTIMACLSLESAGFVLPGEGVNFAAEGNINLSGVLPIATFGGLKARGHPVGATGVYQAAEMTLQLRGEAKANQVAGAEVAVSQNIGGAGSSVFTHVYIKE